jgi:CNT family concentrative nucleoside transporter
VLGLVTMLLLAWIFSTNRRAIRLRTVAWGVGLQIAFAFIVLRWSFGRDAMAYAGNGVNKLLSYAFAGSEFVFGQLGRQHSSFGSIVAFQVLPTIIFISALFAALYHLGIMQIVIRGFAWGMQPWASPAQNHSTSPPPSLWARPKRRSPSARFSRT